MNTIHLVGSAHLDPVWLWRWQEGFAEVKATFRSALDRIASFDDFIFTCAGACYYEWVEQNAPEMFAEVAVRVAEGRWIIVGGWWIQPDCNQPNGEAFARHSLYSQRYFLEKFGKMARVGYNVDSFGHNGNIPQILRKSGMNAYVMMRPGDHENPDLPQVFTWEGIDGSCVPTYRIAHTYNWWYDDTKMPQTIELAEKLNLPQMFFYGVGNHGGGPTVRNLHALHDYQKQYDGLVFSSPEGYFEALTQDLPLWKDDLQHHASGCYSTTTKIKAQNRRAEARLAEAESWATVAGKLLGLKWDTKSVRRAWTKVLFNQFHDIAGGCSIQQAYDDAAESYGEALNIGAELQNAALQKISWAVDTMGPVAFPNDKDLDWSLWEQAGKGTPVVVFNPLGHEVTNTVQLNRPVKGVTDADGNPIPIQSCRSQQTNGRTDKWNTVFLATIPPLGYRLYWAYLNDEKPAQLTGMLEADSNSIENDWYKLTFEPHTGYLLSLYDKKAGRETLAAPGAVPVVIDEQDSDTWGHKIFRYNREVARFTYGTVKLMEQGNVRLWMRVENRYGQSSMRQDFIIYRDKPGIEVRVKVDWHEKHKMLKLSFPAAFADANISNLTAHYEIPFGAIQRPTNGEEEPGQRWVTVSDGCNGLALINDSKYAYDVQNNDLRMTVVRGAIWADHYGERDEWCEFMDQGYHTFTYQLLPYEGGWQNAKIPNCAEECTHPLTHVVETYHQGPLGAQGSFVKMGEGLAISALKPAESGDGLVLRIYETRGKATRADIEMWNHKWQADFGAYEVKTFLITDDSVAETDLLERVVD